MALPHEDVGRREVQRVLGTQLREMDRLLHAATKLLDGPRKVGKQRGIDQTVAHVIAGFYTKACKTFRAVQVVAEAGLAEDAFILSRSLFETLVLIGWILKQSSKRRTEMYLAHLVMRNRKWLGALSRTKGLKRYTKRGTLRQVDAEIAAAQERLGRDFTPSLASTYSGLSLEDTAKRVAPALGKVYQLFYRHTSGFGHGSDLRSHLNVREEGISLTLAPGPSPNLVRAMAMSYDFLRAMMKTVNARFGLGHEALIDSAPAVLSPSTLSMNEGL